MSTGNENLVRQALELQASQAVDPERIRAALPARAARRRRNHRVGVISAAVAAIAATGAITMPALALRGNGQDGGPQQPGAASSTVSTASQPAPGAVPPISVSLRFRPTWLPDGYRERSRQAFLSSDLKALVTRVWSIRSTGSMIELDLFSKEGGAQELGGGGTPVDVNGKQGVYRGEKSATSGTVRVSSVAWPIDANTVIKIMQQDGKLSQDDMLKIARSVVADSASLSVPLRVGWLPAGMAASSVVSEEGPNSTWTTKMTVSEDGSATTGTASKDPGSQRSGWIGIGTWSPAPEGGDPLTIGGRPARYVTTGQSPDSKTGYLVVDLDQGLLLTVTDRMAMTRDELIKIAESVTVEGKPDSAGIGR